MPYVDGEAAFQKGEKYLLFLAKSTAENMEGKELYAANAMYRSKFVIIDEAVKDPKYAKLTNNKTDLLQRIKDQRNQFFALVAAICSFAPSKSILSKNRDLIQKEKIGPLILMVCKTGWIMQAHAGSRS